MARTPGRPGARAAAASRTSRRLARAALVLAVLWPPLAQAAIDGPTLRHLKRATVFVSLGTQRRAGSGSGFLVHRDGRRGVIVTNAHVVRRAARGALRVVFDSGTRRARTIPATLLGSSRARDLAILEVDDGALPEPLEIPAGATVSETQTVHIVGFPFGKGFATNRETPTVTISRGTVSSQRLDVNDQPRLMQIDGDLNPGNSGGPIVDERGRVVGVAVATVKQTNIGFAIPLAPLVEILAGTLTDIAAERTRDGVAISARRLDPLGGFHDARLRVAALDEDAVLDRVGDDGRWRSIAPQLAGSAFRQRQAGIYEALHPVPRDLPAGRSIVGQISVLTAGGVRHLPPFRIRRGKLTVALEGPDSRGVPDAARAETQTRDDAPATATPAELAALFKAAGLDAQMASMATSRGSEIFDQQPRDEEESTVRERLVALIRDEWTEDRIRRIYVRSFEADPNADARRRVLRRLELPAMQLLHLTPDRLDRVSRKDLESLEDTRRRNRDTFNKRLALMRQIDERRNFSKMIDVALATSIGSISRLVNDLAPKNRRMAPELLERDMKRTMIALNGKIRRVVPLMLAHEYRDAREADLRDYIAHLDSAPMRWLSERELAAYTAVISSMFSEAEDEIHELFREVRREALGLAEAPDLTGLQGADAAKAILDAYGKRTVIEFLLKRRGGEITVQRGGSYVSRFGRPREDRVTPHSVYRDMQAMALEPQRFAAALEQHLVDQAYKTRRLATNAERMRLLTALRRARLGNRRTSASSRLSKLAASERKRAREAKKQCRRRCDDEQDRCRTRTQQQNDMCRNIAAGNFSVAASRRRRECLDAVRVERKACQTRYRNCRKSC